MKMIGLLKKAYYRLFFFFFRMYKPSPYGGKETDSFTVILTVIPLSAIVIANIFTIYYICSRFTNSPIIKRVNIPLIFSVLVIFLNYVLFFHKKRYLKIKIMFENEEKRIRHRRSFFCIVFCILSLFGMVIIDTIFGRPPT